MMSRFFNQGGQLDIPVRDVTLFLIKEVTWIPASLASRFFNQGGQLDLPVRDNTFSLIKEVSWIPLLVAFQKCKKGVAKQDVEHTPNYIMARRSSLGLAGRRPALA